jgi:hypothetical protein
MIGLILFTACQTSLDPLHTPTEDSADPSGSDDTSAVDTQDTPPAAIPNVVINEVMANNGGMILDENGVASDWVELFNTSNVPADLSGVGMSDDWTDKLKFTFPEGTILDGGDHLLLWANGEDGATGTNHLPFQLDQDGEGVGLFSADEEEIDWVVFPEQEENTVLARLPDGADIWEEMLWGTPGTTNQLLSLEDVTVVGIASTWSYWDQGPGIDANWAGLDFDDNAWPAGEAPLGYGDSQTTQVGYGPNSGNKYITVYYRQTVDIDADVATTIQDATLSLRCDDGAILYLNGQELYRYNMPSGNVSFDTVSSSTISGDAENTYTVESVSTDAFVSGTNVLAAEVHQANSTSSDTTFDAVLQIQVVVAE